MSGLHRSNMPRTLPNWRLDTLLKHRALILQPPEPRTQHFYYFLVIPLFRLSSFSVFMPPDERIAALPSMAPTALPVVTVSYLSDSTRSVPTVPNPPAGFGRSLYHHLENYTCKILAYRRLAPLHTDDYRRRHLSRGSSDCHCSHLPLHFSYFHVGCCSGFVVVTKSKRRVVSCGIGLSPAARSYFVSFILLSFSLPCWIRRVGQKWSSCGDERHDRTP